MKNETGVAASEEFVELKSKIYSFLKGTIVNIKKLKV